MKTSLLSLFSFLALATSATADPISWVSNTHPYTRWPDQMESFVATEEKALNKYLEKALGCWVVKFDFNNLRSPTLSKKGSYYLSLKAACSTSFRDFTMDVTYGSSRGEPIELHLSYILDDRRVEKTIRMKLGDS